jgi:GntR family transcriptional regulator
MTPFRFTLTPGQSIFDQVVFAATKAFVSGEMQPGDPFPSVRALAAQLRINPNTAAKVVQHLVQERWLEVSPGVGTVVATSPSPRAGDRQRLLDHDIEQWAVEAKRLGLGLKEVTDALASHWRRLDDAGQDKTSKADGE